MINRLKCSYNAFIFKMKYINSLMPIRLFLKAVVSKKARKRLSIGYSIRFLGKRASARWFSELSDYRSTGGIGSDFKESRVLKKMSWMLGRLHDRKDELDHG